MYFAADILTSRFGSY